MKSRKVHYKRALKKQILTIATFIVVLTAYPLISGLKTDLEFYTWLYLAVFSSYGVYIILKKQSKEALCPHCRSDLFEVIETSKSVKLDFKFCPSCGNGVEV